MTPSAPPPYLRPVPDGLELDVLVQPRASRSRLVGLHDGRLKVQLAAPPVDGAANEALLELLATVLNRPRSTLVLRRGDTGRRKTVLLNGCPLAPTLAALSTVMA